MYLCKCYLFFMHVHRALAVVGLTVIAMGTGGIKPCVSAFGGDQFQDSQVTEIIFTRTDNIIVQFYCVD